MNNIAFRIKYALDYRGLKPKDLSEKTGISRSSISEWLSGKYEPKQDKIFLIAEALNIDEGWLLGLDIPLERKTDITTIYNQLNEKRQTKVYNYAEKQLDEQNGIADLEEHRQKKQIVNGRSTAAGSPLHGDTQDEKASVMIVDQTEIPVDADEIVTIAGDSMEPDYPKGSQVFIHYQPEVEEGEVAIVAIEDEGVTCKRVYYDFDEKEIILESINEEYDDMVYPLNEVRIIGKVL